MQSPHFFLAEDFGIWVLHLPNGWCTITIKFGFPIVGDVISIAVAPTRGPFAAGDCRIAVVVVAPWLSRPIPCAIASCPPSTWWICGGVSCAVWGCARNVVGLILDPNVVALWFSISHGTVEIEALVGLVGEILLVKAFPMFRKHYPA